MHNLAGTEVDLPQEQRRVRDRCHHPSNTFVEFGREEVEQSIGSRFEKQVAAFPNRTAVKSHRWQLTYSELNDMANRVGQAVLAELGPGQEPIALLFETDAMAIAAMLGTLKAGKFFVALEPSLPPGRLKYMLEDSRANLILTNSRYANLASELADDQARVVNVDSATQVLSCDSIDLEVSPRAEAYIVYTSGSTGRPKGVLHSHRNLLHNSMCHINHLGICADDHLTLLHSYGSSAAYPDIFGALLCGAALYSLDVREEGFTQLERWLLEERITILNWVVTPFRHFTEALGEPSQFVDLRVVMLGSEPIVVRDLEPFSARVSPACVFVARFGTSEAIIFRYFFFDRETHIAARFVPAGYAVPDKDVIVLDDAGNAVGFDCIGEIAIRSSYLALGYWRAAALTEAAFLSDPMRDDRRIYRTGDLGILRSDGCLEFVGRRDFQVKIRGYRVELAEIEAALRELDVVREAAVITRENLSRDAELVAYYVPATQQMPSSGQIRLALSRTLPDYMIPVVIVPLNALPLTPAGKVDRQALRERSGLRSEPERLLEVPRSTLEVLLAGILAQSLQIEGIGVHDDFFELGGNSLLAAQVVSHIGRTCGVDFALSDFFAAPTVEGLAALVNRLQDRKSDAKAEVGQMEGRDLETALRQLGHF